MEGWRRKEVIRKSKYNIENVRKIFEDENCELLDNIYAGSDKKLNYRCNCGNISKITLNSFLSGHRCKKCGIEKMANKRRFSFKYVEQYFKDNGYKLLEKEYITCETKMKYECPRGHMHSASFLHFSRGSRCKECVDEDQRGKNSPFYDHNLTDKDRGDRRLISGYTQWIKNVYIKNNYICQKCKSKNKLNAHHIEGYAKNEKLRLDRENGITFCLCCHKEFHKIYGKKDINRQQLNKFLKIGVKNV